MVISSRSFLISSPSKDCCTYAYNQARGNIATNHDTCCNTGIKLGNVTGVLVFISLGPFALPSCFFAPALTLSPLCLLIYSSSLHIPQEQQLHILQYRFVPFV
jgi:hypothetical protein